MTAGNKRLHSLIGLFSGAALTVLAQGEPASAQDGGVSGAVNDNADPGYSQSVPASPFMEDRQSGFSRVADDAFGMSDPALDASLPPHLRFKPLALCRQAEEDTPDDIKTLALDDARFTAVESWMDKEEASQILTYRLCREDNLASVGDSITMDVLVRVHAPVRFASVITPFIEASPGFFAKMLNFFHSRLVGENGLYQNALIFDTDILMAAAKDPLQGQRILDGEHYFKEIPRYDEVVRQVFTSNPLLIFSYRDRYAQYVGGDEDTMATLLETLHERVSDPEYAKKILLYYSNVRDYDTDFTLLRKAIAHAPGTYFKAVSRGEGSRVIADNPEFFPDTDLLLRVSKAPVSPEENANLILYYRAYRHLPEAREILQNAVNSDVKGYLGLVEQYSVTRLTNYWDDDFVPVVSTAQMLELTQDTNGAGRVINYCDMLGQDACDYDVVKVAAEKNPEKYLQRYSRITYSKTSKLREYDFVLDAQQLKRISDNNKNVSLIVNAYPAYRHLAEARDIAQNSIRTKPEIWGTYLISRDSYSALIEDDLAPTLADFQRRAETVSDRDRPQFISYVIAGYKNFERPPGYQGFVQDLANLYPYQYLMRIQIGRHKNVPYPTAEALSRHMDDSAANAAIVIDAYRYFANSPDAIDVLRKAAALNPKALASKRIYFQDDPQSMQGMREILRVQYEMMPDVLAASIHKTQSGLYSYIEFAREEPDILDFVVREVAHNKQAVLYYLAHPENEDRIEQLDTHTRDTLVEMARGALRGQGDIDYDIALLLIKNGSWFEKAGFISDQDRGMILSYVMAADLKMGLRLLNENPDFVTNPSVVKEAVLANSLYFLAEATKNEKTADYTLVGVRVSYQEMLESAQNLIGAGNAPKANAQIITILNNLHDYDAATRFALIESVPPRQRLQLAAQKDSLYYTSTYNRIIEDALAVLREEPDARQWLFDNTQAKGQFTSALGGMAQNAMHFGKTDVLLGTMNDGEIDILADLMTDEVRNAYRISSSSQSSRIAAIVPIFKHMEEQGRGQEVEARLIGAFRDGDRDSPAFALTSALYAQNVDISPAGRPFFEAAQKFVTPLLGNYMRDTLMQEDLRDEKGRNFQMMVFYDDKDGHATFGHFKSIYQADKRWGYEDHGSFISFTRGAVYLYANKPQFEKDGPRAIENYVAEQEGTLSVLVHRGHSYHVRNTASQYLDQDIKFFWLGACRSADIWGYIDAAPDMQFIYSQNIGTMLVNDPLLKDINDRLAAGENIDWQQIRDDAYRMSGGDVRVKDYIFPDGSLEYGIHMTQAYLQEDRKMANEMMKALKMLAASHPDVLPPPDAGVGGAPPQGRASAHVDPDDYFVPGLQ